MIAIRQWLIGGLLPLLALIAMPAAARARAVPADRWMVAGSADTGASCSASG